MTTVARRETLTSIGDRWSEVKHGHKRWYCRYRCFCGTEFTSNTNDVKAGKVRSCGCGRARRKHGRAGTVEHRAWLKMISRCHRKTDRSYQNYGGRGIVVCDEWRHDFAAFLSHVGLKPGSEYSIDRIDNDKGYEPGNVRWATRTVQNRNRRITVRDSSGRPIADVAEQAGVVHPRLAVERLRHGATTEGAVLTPKRFEDYQVVTNYEVVASSTGTHLLLALACGCMAKRQHKKSRPIPRVAKCKNHPMRTTNA